MPSTASSLKTMHVGYSLSLISFDVCQDSGREHFLRWRVRRARERCRQTGFEMVSGQLALGLRRGCCGSADASRHASATCLGLVSCLTGSGFCFAASPSERCSHWQAKHCGLLHTALGWKEKAMPGLQDPKPHPSAGGPSTRSKKNAPQRATACSRSVTGRAGWYHVRMRGSEKKIETTCWLTDCLYAHLASLPVSIIRGFKRGWMDGLINFNHDTRRHAITYESECAPCAAGLHRKITPSSVNQPNVPRWSRPCVSVWFAEITDPRRGSDNWATLGPKFSGSGKTIPDVWYTWRVSRQIRSREQPNYEAPWDNFVPGTVVLR